MTTPQSAVLEAVEKFAPPALGLRATREELLEWATSGASLAPPLSPEDAIRRMIPSKHRGLVVSWASAYAGRCRLNCLDAEEIFNAGHVGLHEAARRFDVGRGCVFSTLATHRIRASIAATIRRGGYCSDLRLGRAVGPTLAADAAMVAGLVSGLHAARDRAIVAERFGLDGAKPLTLSEVAVRHGLSRRVAGLRVHEILGRLRERAEAEGFGPGDFYENAT